MLRYLAEWLVQYHSAFNVFSYLTLRSILAALTALLISFLVGPTMIRKLAEHQVGQR
ncbi:MAG: phospho-N-acetylmuramoyl-pentapeptide-transferase, partial [Pseudomonadota bacterium]|nr:phospho-N-acetylmuramoyl-pentapeptide-transferase [Pseudomonadota bacterium]